MVDSVEHRVEMHRIGRERRAEGKSRWEKTVDISAYVHEQYSEDKVLNSWHVMRNVADLIASKLGRYLNEDSASFDPDFAEMIEDMRERSLESLSSEDDPVDAVGSYMDQVYDFFDHNNIWAGMGSAKIVNMIDPDGDSAIKP
ncbi:hypothetical protein G6L37_01700 [Agrobacterium rubi]|nr:hypothetical protein [Agrobacterium rubi]NTF24108.1 hypothetical protein [Agrobacterium rubi]